MSNNNIPKTIHYCWFGGNPLPESAERCIASWKKYCPDYEIVEWNETNVDISKSDFTRAAYKSKKWAFVSDYVRYKVVYENGGVYLDIDVEVIKSLDDLLSHEAYIGFEGREYVNSGLGFGACKGNKILKEIIGHYDNIDYDNYKDNPSEIATPIIVTNILKNKGFVSNGEFQTIESFVTLPEDYLCPKSPFTRLTNITQNTYSIHHYDASWVDDIERGIIDKLEEDAKKVSSRFPDLVSILIPAYNAEEYLREAVDSALSQTYKNLEVLIINDGSTDSTEQIALSYGARVRYIHKENGGVASALNIGIKNMRGKYFSWLSHDDAYHHERVEILVEQAKKEGPKTIIISDWDIIDSKSNKIRRSKLDDRLETAPRGFLAFDRNTWLNACAMLIPKELFAEVGLFDETLRTTQDYDMHNRLINQGVKYKIVHKPLFLSRQHSKQGSLIETNALEMSDQMHVQIINDLSKEEILKYFESNYADIDKVYKSFLNNGYKQTPALVMSRMIAVLKDANLDKQATGLMQRCLIGLDAKESTRIASEIITKSGKKTKKRLLFSSGYWRTGGMERVLANLFKELGSTYEIFLLTPDEGMEGCIELPNGITHIKMSRILYEDCFDTVALSYALALDIDVAVGFLNLFDKQLDFYSQCRENNIKTIASNHEYFFYPYTSYDMQIRELANKRSKVFRDLDAVIWLTNFSTEIHNINNNNGYLIHNPNTYEVQSAEPYSDKEYVVLSIGRFNDYVKRVDRIIECFREVYKKIPEAKLVLVGTSDIDLKIPRLGNRSIRDMIRESKVPLDNIVIVGETNNMRKYYEKARVYLLASVNEGFPMVLTEAACFGLPAVCNNIPGIEDILVDGHNGFIVPQDDISSMAESVNKLLLDDKLRLNMSVNSKGHVAKFNSSIIAKKWKLLIDVLVSDKPEKQKKQILDKQLSSKITDRQSFEENLINVLNDSFSQSNNMLEELNNNLRDGVVFDRKPISARYKALVKRTAREYKNNGSKTTIKKVVKRVSNKSKFELKRTTRLVRKGSSSKVSKNKAGQL